MVLSGEIGGEKCNDDEGGILMELKESQHFPETSLYAALDLGSTKVVAIVGNALEDNLFEIVSVGVAPTGNFIRNGTIVDVQQAVSAINRALDQVVRVVGRPVKKVVVGFAGGEVVGTDQRVIVALRDREVQLPDIEKVMQEARSMVNRPVSEILHVIPKSYTIDDLSGIPNPIGMVGNRLEASVHVIKGSEMVIANLKRTVERAGLSVSDGDLILHPLASARVVLSEDDKELGVVLVDIGGGTTNVAVYVNGAIVGVRVIPLGGINMTRDLAIVRRVSQEEAERIKIQTLSRLSPAEPGPDGTEGAVEALDAPSREVVEIVEARLVEILERVVACLKEMKVDIQYLQRGVVLTGGVSNMPQMVEIARKVLSPLHITLGSVESRVQGVVDRASLPEYSSAVGLLFCAKDHWGEMVPELDSPKQEVLLSPPEKKPAGSIWSWIKEII
ncbi:cell division protein FtsA [Leptospirillum ferrooxidans]|jgi:cell division protein FtsA|uniref:Cell division protein FtsA n=1 Tax=Leptospirillum ferrooxidans (strain C2-3) TaxID=1162668 RepID=I0IQB2_LEPFC|nr:cell division protein FtsA [Leptospirillum ferrooxidans]BAM07461.1 putative cell division protein [Leptospirillum ferrooxidans C2-3]